VGFTRDDVQRIAALARLELTGEEQDLFARQLGDILRYADEVRAVDTAGVPPTSHALAGHPAFREDGRRPSLPRDEALANAPDTDAGLGFFRVPRVLGS
jgi:aspartyl-tRNA(Asn)/glutamyl-tRNA(Gln) amidotransferase subunit C